MMAAMPRSRLLCIHRGLQQLPGTARAFHATPAPPAPSIWHRALSPGPAASPLRVGCRRGRCCQIRDMFCHRRSIYLNRYRKNGRVNHCWAGRRASPTETNGRDGSAALALGRLHWRRRHQRPPCPGRERQGCYLKGSHMGDPLLGDPLAPPSRAPSLDSLKPAGNPPGTRP
jgi:hypothetical protein